jgi:hypothetical protein
VAVMRPVKEGGHRSIPQEFQAFIRGMTLEISAVGPKTDPRRSDEIGIDGLPQDQDGRQVHEIAP